MIKEREITIHRTRLREFVKDKLLNHSSTSVELWIADNSVGRTTDRYSVIKEEWEMITLSLKLWFPD